MKTEVRDSRGVAVGGRPSTGLWGAVHSWAAHLHRYLISGGITVVADFSLFWFLTSGMEVWYLHAHFISRTFGGVVCFGLNRQYTFANRRAGRFASEAVRFLALYAVSFVFSSVLVYAFVSGVAMGAVIGKFVAECIVFLFNYTVMKYWVMAHRRTDV